MQIFQSSDVPPFICFSCKERFDAASDFLNIIRSTQATLATLEQNGDLKNEPVPLDIDVNQEIKDEDLKYIDYQEVETETDDVIKYEEEIEYIESEAEEVFNDLVLVPPSLPNRSRVVIEEPKPKRRRKGQLLPKGYRAAQRLQKLSPEEQEQYRIDDKRIDRFFNFKCEHCELSLDTYPQFQHHMRTLHGEKIPILVCCNRKLKSRCHLLDHVNYHENPEALQCQICFKIARDSNQLKNHLKNHDNDDETKKFECNDCRKRFVFKSALKSHIYKHLTPAEKDALKHFQCHQCDQSFPTNAFLKYHVNWKHLGKYKTTCEVCYKVFMTRHRYKLHYLEEHADINVAEAECPACKTMFKNKYSMAKHYDRIHKGAGPHPCTLCGRTCPNYFALEEHINNVHVKALGKHQCEQCGKTFKTLVNKREHMSMNHGAAPLYKCDFCDRTFNSNANMYTHRKKQHPVLLAQLKEAKRVGQYPKRIN